jgi:hypothetical protein
VLQTKGVSEAEIAAAQSDPELMKKLILRSFGPESRRPEISNNPMQPGYVAALWNGTTPGADTAPPSTLDPKDRQAGIQSNESVYCRTMHGLCRQQCYGARVGFDTFGPFRACMRTCMHNAGCLDF